MKPKKKHYRKQENALLIQTLYDLRMPLAAMKERLEALAGRGDLPEDARSEVYSVLQQTGVFYRMAEGVGHHFRMEKKTPNVWSARLRKIRTYARLYSKQPCEGSQGSFQPCANCTGEQDWKFIAHVKKYVEENMNNPGFNIDSLCDLLNMSRTSFYNKLKALTGQAPADYVRLIRLNCARVLLREHRYPITEVAEMTGFSDARYFREVFKKHFGVSPSRYAKDNLIK